MPDDRDKWAELFGDDEPGGSAGSGAGDPRPAEGDYVDPGPPERLGEESDDHDVTPPPAQETGNLTDEFSAIESQFLGELDAEYEPDEQPAADQQAGAEQPSDEPPAEEPPAPEAPPPPVEEPPAEEPPAQEPPAGEPPAQEPPAEEPPAQEPPAEEPPAEEAPAQESRAEEPPAEEPGVEAESPPVPADPQPSQESEPVVISGGPPPLSAGATTEAQLSLAAAVEALSKDQIDERKPAPLWTRFLAGSMVIVISMATATAVSFLLYLTEIADGLADHSGELRGVQERLANVEGGEPQTIMILGSDIRPGDESGRSDTTMLLRLDADRNAISLFSLPRDLKVNIPGVGIDRLNAAYSYGGPKKTLEVVKQITGLEINHLVNVDFNGFAKAVDAIDCVYVDVDRDYFHSNEGLAPSEQFAEIDVSAGYQRLCGLRALQFVRYRHTDNDIVRSARQQDFLREARQKVSPARLWSDRDELIEIFTKHTSSDIDDPRAMLEVLKLFIASRGAPINQIHFETGFDQTYVTASDSDMKRAVAQFLGETQTPDAKASGGSRGGGKGKRKRNKPRPQDAGSMVDSGAETLAFVELMARRKRMPAYMPTQIVPGSFFDDETRGYQIKMPNEKRADAYKLVFQIGGQFGVPEYYGVMATEWTDPPILENASETRTIDGREYMLFYDSGRLRLVGFQTNRGSYWVSNTLLQSLSEEQMLAVAASMREVEA